MAKYLKNIIDELTPPPSHHSGLMTKIGVIGYTVLNIQLQLPLFYSIHNELFLTIDEHMIQNYLENNNKELI